MELLEAIGIFRESGKTDELFKVIGITDEKTEPLLVLQLALETAVKPKLRDMIEEISWSLASYNKLPAIPSDSEVKSVVSSCVESYGPEIKSLFTGIDGFVRSLLSGEGSGLPKNAIVAAAGLESQKLAAIVWLNSESFAKENIFFSPTCEICGGSDGGNGYIYCPDCLQKAMNVINSSGFNPFTGLSAEEKKLEMQKIAYQIIDKYGCKRCGNQPRKPCDCQSVSYVPQNCKDGWVVSGKKTATGEKIFQIIRVK